MTDDRDLTNISRRRLLQQGVGCVALGAVGGWAEAAPREAAVRIAVAAPAHDVRNAPLSFLLPAQARGPAQSSVCALTADDGSGSLACQVDRAAGPARVTFLLPDLPAGVTRNYTLRAMKGEAAPPAVSVKPNGDDMDVFVGGGMRRFTTYKIHAGPNKPAFYPILTPEGGYMVRHWPVEPDAVPGESHDHPHHRGLWFTHSSVNGVDFWTEQGEKIGRTVHKGYEQVYGGPVAGGFRAHTEWRMPDDALIAVDTRNVRFVGLPNGDRLMDFEITLQPVGGPLHFGDNKDGMFGLRLPDSLAVTPSVKPSVPGTGHILNSVGDTDKAVWSKPADWVDYWGPIAGKTYGVAIFDNPANLRHPETWHARDYALFTVNPFGLHDFGRGEKGAGDVTVPVDKTLMFRYRLLFHAGDATTAHVADHYAAYADPPRVTVLGS